MPFQKAGCAYIIRAFENGQTGVLMSDEMGLGKTVQAIIIHNRLKSKSTLIICPAGLKLNWRNELNRWLTNHIEIGIAVGDFFPDTPIVIVNYDLVKRHADTIRSRQWDLMIADECHYLKAGTKSLRGKYTLGHKSRSGWDPEPIPAKYRIYLTGTPLVNRPVELWPLIHSLDPDQWSNFMAFAKRYCDAFQDRWGWNFTGSSNLDELQNILRSRCMVRRLKKDVLTELPPKRRQIIEVAPNGAQAVVDAETNAYEATEARLTTLRTAAELAKAESDEAYLAAVSKLQEATRAQFTEMAKLRHNTALAKIPAVIDHLESLLESGEKIVLFAWHHDIIDAIHDKFPSSVEVTGNTSMDARQKAVDKFQTDPDCKLFLGNIQAAGVGITLTASSHVVFAELDWVPGNMSQAEDRCHRIGAVNPVLVQHLVLDGSLDARIAKVLVAKQEVLDATLDNETKATLEIVPPEPSVTEHSTPQEIEAVAITLSHEQVQAIHQALRQLSAMCDGARSIDAMGFNKLDTNIGRSLALRETLTPKQAALGRKIVRKYRRQLDPDLMQIITGVKND